MAQGCKKGGFALALLQLGYSVLISDVDAVMLDNPVKFFDVDPIVKLADLWVSTDSLSPSNDRCVPFCAAIAVQPAHSWEGKLAGSL
jgi:hypothetical protein